MFAIGMSVAWLAAVGCAGPQSAATKSVSSVKAAPPTPIPIEPVIQPLTAFSGRVVHVNGPLKYVVIEGVLGRVPPAEQPLNVYRDGQKTGEVTVSSQSRGAHFAADVTVGEARVGDTVRSD